MSTATTPRRAGGYGAYTSGANALQIDWDAESVWDDDEPAAPTRTNSTKTSATRTSAARTSAARTSAARTSATRTSGAKTGATGTSGVTTKPAKAKPTRTAKPTTAVRRSRRTPWVSDVTPAPLTTPAPLPIALPRAPFVLLMVGLVVVGVLGVLVLNTKINENSFRLSDLRSNQAALDLQEQQLRQNLDDLESPGNLRAAATRLGLVPAGTPAFINLPDGRIVGVPQPATGR